MARSCTASSPFDSASAISLSATPRDCRKSRNVIAPPPRPGPGGLPPGAGSSTTPGEGRGGGAEHPLEAVEGPAVAALQLDEGQLQGQVGAEPGVADALEEGVTQAELVTHDVGRGGDGRVVGRQQPQWVTGHERPD